MGAPLRIGLVGDHGEAIAAHRALPRALLLSSGVAAFQEGYRCRFGLNPAFVAALTAGPLGASVLGPQGDVRAVEPDGDPFHVATLFQPERAALQGRVPPGVPALLRASTARRAANEESA